MEYDEELMFYRDTSWICEKCGFTNHEMDAKCQNVECGKEGIGENAVFIWEGAE